MRDLAFAEFCIRINHGIVISKSLVNTVLMRLCSPPITRVVTSKIFMSEQVYLPKTIPNSQYLISHINKIFMPLSRLLSRFVCTYIAIRPIKQYTARSCLSTLPIQASRSRYML